MFAADNGVAGDDGGRSGPPGRRLAPRRGADCPLGGTADVDATKEQVQAAWEKKYPKRTHEEIAAEANKNNPIELSAIDFDLWVLQYACDSRIVATGKARDEVK